MRENRTYGSVRGGQSNLIPSTRLKGEGGVLTDAFYMPPRGGIYTHRREAAIPHPLNPPAEGRQNLLNLLNPGREAAPLIKGEARGP